MDWSRPALLLVAAVAGPVLGPAAASGAPVEPRSATAHAPDLTVVSAEARLQRGRIRGAAVVRNAGQGAARPSTLAVRWQTGKLTRELGRGSLRRFSGGAARKVTFDVPAPSGRSGRVRIVVCTDARRVLREARESNNCRTAGTVRLPRPTNAAAQSQLPAAVVAEVPGAGAAAPAAPDPQPAVEPVVPLPRLNITTVGAAPILDRETYVPGAMTLDPNGTTATALSGTLEIRGRGNSTWLMPKKPYRLKLTKAAPLLGMPANRHWALLANWFDDAKQRNALAFELGEATRLAWTPKVRWVEVVLNGAPIGLYQLAEHVRLDPTRVNIDAMKAADVSGAAVTGGYLLERDERLDLDTEQGFRTAAKNQPIAVKEPENAQPEQLAYIRGYVDDFEAALFSASFTDPDTGYARFIDVDSFVDWYLVSEFTRNHDAWTASVFLHKPRGGRLTLGPLWDFDLSMGGALLRWGWESGPPEGWWARTESPWFTRLFDDPAFSAAVAERWAQLRPVIAGLPASVDTRAAALSSAIRADALVWNYEEDTRARDVADLQDWLARRTAWMDQALGYVP